MQTPPSDVEVMAFAESEPVPARRAAQTDEAGGAASETVRDCVAVRPEAFVAAMEIV